MRQHILIALALTIACRGPIEAPVVHESTPVEDVSNDLDGNGVQDFGNQTFAAGQTVTGATFVVFISPVLPEGGASNVAMALRGFGSGQYSDAPNGWAENWMSMPEVYGSDGYVVGYGVTALRDGDYEVNCARTDAQLYEQGGWCDPGKYTAYDDDERYVAAKVNFPGQECQRTDHTWVFRVQGGIIGGGSQLAPVDTSDCPEED